MYVSVQCAQKYSFFLFYRSLAHCRINDGLRITNDCQRQNNTLAMPFATVKALVAATAAQIGERKAASNSKLQPESQLKSQTNGLRLYQFFVFSLFSSSFGLLYSRLH